MTSPRYPSNYPHNQDRNNEIVVAAGSKIELTFVDFEIEFEAGCRYDYVEGNPEII